MKYKKVSAVMAAASAVALIVGCSNGGGAASQTDGEPADTIRVTLEAPSTFDPATGISVFDWALSRHSFDSLVRKEGDTILPGLASEWEATPTSATFTIRDGATCSDGTEITPTIVRDSLEYFANSGGSQSPRVFGGQIPTISADDEAETVTIDLERPWPDLIQGMTTAATGIICPAGLEDLDALAAGSVEGAESGPYVLQSSEPGVRYTYKLREEYDAWPEWTNVEGRPAENLEFVMSADTSATTNLVLDGQLDIAKIMPESVTRFEGQEGYDVTPFLFSDFFIIFNEREGSPFADAEARRAVAQTVNREEIGTVAFEDFGQVATTFVAEGSKCYTGDDSALIAEDFEAAKEVLDGMNIRIIGPQVFGTNGAGNVYLQERLRAAGANVELENTDVGTWISTVFAEPSAWDMTVYAAVNFTGSLASPLTTFTSPEPAEGGTNVGATQSVAANEAFEGARFAESDEEYCGLINEAANAIAADAHGVPLITDEFLYVQRPGFDVTMPTGTLDDHIFRIVD